MAKSLSKSRGIEAKLARLRALRQESPTATLVTELRQALADKSNLIAGEAAEIIGERGLGDFMPELLATFDRFMIEPEESDKLCRAKLAIVEALNKLDYHKPEIFLTAIRHVQLEPRWGKPDDTAAALRGAAAFGLVRIGYRDVLLLLVDLLADSEKVARISALRALGGSGLLGAVPLLRLKARVGDKDSEVTAESLSALMAADAKESLSFVAEFLHHADDVIQQGAAFALGESRRAEALDILRQFWPAAGEESLREAVLLAIAMTRLPAAIDFLLEIVAGDPRHATSAVSALAIHRHNEAIRERVATAVHETKNPALAQRYKEKFEK